MSKNITITITLEEENNRVKFQATVEKLQKSDVTYFLDIINDEIKKSSLIMEGLTRTNSAYIEEYIDLII